MNINKLLSGKESLATGLFTALLVSAIAGCKSEDNAPRPEGNTVKVELSYTLSEVTPPEAIRGMLVSYMTPDGVVTDTIRRGEAWTKELTFTEFPQTVGMQMHCMLEFDIASGTVIGAVYDYTCNVTLMKDEEVVDNRFVCDAQTVSLVTEQGLAYSQIESAFNRSHLFNVRLSEIKQTDTDEYLPTQVMMEDYTLYYIDEASLAPTDCLMHDIMLSRFPNRKQWDGATLSKGDFLYLHGAEAVGITREQLAPSLNEGLICIIDGLEKGQDIIDFMNKTGYYYNITVQPDDDISKYLYIYAGIVSLSFDPTYKDLGLMLSVPPKDWHGNVYTTFCCQIMTDLFLTYIKIIFKGNEGKEQPPVKTLTEQLLGKWECVRTREYKDEEWTETTDSSGKATVEYRPDGTGTVVTIYDGKETTSEMTWTLDEESGKLTMTRNGYSNTGNILIVQNRLLITYENSVNYNTGEQRTGLFQEYYDPVEDE